MMQEAKIMELWKKTIQQYTQEESSSVRVEVAEQILISIHYVLNLYLNGELLSEDGLQKETTGSADAASDDGFSDIASSRAARQKSDAKRFNALMLQDDIESVYRKAITHIRNKLKETKALFKACEASRLQVESDVYRDLFEQAIPDFLRKYDIQYNAHNTMCSIDYPLVMDDLTEQGVAYIHHYLTNLQLETAFIGAFPIAEFNAILADYGRQNRLDILTAPINFFELAFANAFCAHVANMLTVEMLVEEDASSPHIPSLLLTEDDFTPVNDWLKVIPKTDFSAFIKTTVMDMLRTLQLTDPHLMAYVGKYVPVFTLRLRNALDNDHYENLVVIQENNEDRLQFEKTVMMDDKKFRLVVEQLLACQDSDLKIELLAKKVTSINDFMDVLAADCLFDYEVQMAFGILSEMDLAVIGLIVFTEDFNRTTFKLNARAIRMVKAECRIAWQEAFLDFLAEKDEVALSEIEGLMKRLG